MNPKFELSKKLIELGWKQIGKYFVNPKNERFVPRNVNGKTLLQKAENFIKDEKLQKEAAKAKAVTRQNISKFNKMANEFFAKTGFDLNTESWQRTIPKRMRMKPDELQLYVTKGGPTIIKHYDTLLKNAETSTYPAMRRINGRYEALYLDGLPLRGEHVRTKGWRPVSKETAEAYLIETSPNAAGKFVQTGIPMYRGVADRDIPKFFQGTNQRWYNSDINGAPTYAGKDGLQFLGVPVKTPTTKIEILRTPEQYPTSKHWRNDEPIGHFIPEQGIGITETPIYDDLSKAYGFYTILDPNIQVKALKGGTGLFDLSKKNPLLSVGIPAATLATLATILNTDDEQVY